MRKLAVCVVALALVGWLSVTIAAADKSDHALLNGPECDTSGQCGATKIENINHVPVNKPTSFIVHITMTNRGDLDGFVRVTYQDSDFVNYAIPKGTTVQISLAGGGTPNVDQLITVTNGESGAVLLGQMSLITEDGKPIAPLAPNFCTTT